METLWLLGCSEWL